VNVSLGAQTDVGRTRETNEDGYLAEDPLYAVADGMGGHRAGEVASRMALEALAEVEPDGGPHSLPERVKAANRVVHQRASEDKDLEGMGTTLTALVMDGSEARIAHVGDSRAYLLRDGELKMLTEDHTLVRRMVTEGKLTTEEAERHPQRSILTRALGVDAEVDVDEMTVRLRGGDRLLLCTDGLTSMLGEDRIADILRSESDPQAAADALVEAANEAGGQDNITVVVLDLEGVSGSPGPDTGDDQELDGRATVPAAAAPGSIAPGADDTLVTTSGEIATARTKGSDDWRGSGAAPARRRWVRWLALTLVLLAAAGVGGKVFIDRQWFVGIHEGNVAIFRGVQGEILGLGLATLVRETDIPADEALQHSSGAGLEEGIPVSNLEEAEAQIALIQADLRGGEEPGPVPSPTDSPSPSETPDDTPGTG
jgi:PPM family protein phosphatase